MKRFLIAILLLNLGSRAMSAEPRTYDLHGFQCQNSPLSVAFPKTLPELRRIGRVLKEEVIGTDAWENYTTREIALHFQGLSVAVVAFSNDPNRYVLSAVKIKGRQWKVSPLKIGRPVQEMLHPFGIDVDRRTQSPIRIRGESDSLIVYIKDGRISEVVYDCYTG